MIFKNQIQLIKDLHQKKGRLSHGLFIVEGEKCVAELLRSKLVPKSVFGELGWINENRALLNPSIEVNQVSPSELERISIHQTPNKVLALVELPKNSIEQVPYKQENILILDTIQDPGNLGTIIRTADWFGIQYIICSTKTADVFSHKVVQATMGSLYRVNIYYTDLKNWLTDKSLDLVGATLDGIDISEFQWKNPSALIIGNEGKGISPTLTHLIKSTVKINSIGNAESLNAAVATGILLDRWLNR